MNTPLRVGVVGIGFGQQVHVPAFRADERCKVTAICASTIERAQKVADRLDIQKYFGDWRQLVYSDEVDAVAIAVPPALQEHITIEALKNGKPVFSEKPLSISVAGARLMTDLAAKSNLANVVDFEFPEIPQWRLAKDLIDSAHMGCLHHVSVSWQLETYANRMGIESWKTDNGQGGGALYSFVSHCFYYIEWLLGPIKKLTATLGKPSSDKRIRDSIVLLQIVLASGITVAVDVRTNVASERKHHLEFHGAKSTLILTNSTNDYINGFDLLIVDRNSKKIEPVTCEDSWPTDHVDGRIRAVSSLARRFIDWATDGSSTKPGFAEGLRVQQLIETAKQSAQSEQ